MLESFNDNLKEENSSLKQANNNLKRKLIEYEEKLASAAEFENEIKKIKSSFEKCLADEVAEMKNKEKILIKKHEDIESQIKKKIKNREEELKKQYLSEVGLINQSLNLLQIENEEIKKDNFSLKR